jgi:hypothetical protein
MNDELSGFCGRLFAEGSLCLGLFNTILAFLNHLKSVDRAAPSCGSREQEAHMHG